MLTKRRAKEIVHQQNQFPYWGNYGKFMTEPEKEHVSYIWTHAQSGNVSIASAVQSIAAGVETTLKPGVPNYNEQDKTVSLAINCN
jgi:hypothetical protein